MNICSMSKFKLFTCDYALDIVIVLLMLRYVFWHFDSVLMDCFEYIFPWCIIPDAYINKEDGAK